MRIKQVNIADYFSLYRFVALPFIILCIILDKRVFTAMLLLISFITDGIDGYLARRLKIKSSRGAKLDSIGDLLTLVSGLAAFLVFERGFFLDHLLIIGATLSLFILQSVIAFIKFKMFTSFHTYLAKIAAVLFALFLVSTPITGPLQFPFYVTFFIAMAEAVEEIVITILLKKPQENVKGLYWVLRK